jgi:hypothetical protein
MAYPLLIGDLGMANFCLGDSLKPGKQRSPDRGLWTQNTQGQSVATLLQRQLAVMVAVPSSLPLAGNP